MQKSVVTLVGQKTNPLHQSHIDKAAQLLGVSTSNWLAEAEACDIFCPQPHAEIYAVLDGFLADAQLDAIAQPNENRRKKALLADMESTIIHQEMLDELARYAGVEDRVKEITRRSMNGELDFREALQERLALLKNLPASLVDDLQKIMTPMEGAKELVATMKANGARCILVSGGFTCFIEKVAGALGFDEFHGNVLGMADGKITGDIVEPVLTKDSKRSILDQTAKTLKGGASDIVAVGDGANDVPMLLGAGVGVAFFGKPNVQKQAPHNIRHTNLRALLWVQGYRIDDVEKAISF